jgi:hypothetical protein
MYKKTMIAGILFAALYVAAIAGVFVLFAAGIGMIVGGQAASEDLAGAGFFGGVAGGVTIFLSVVLGAISGLFLFGSIVIAKRGKNSASAKEYNEKTKGTTVFLVFQGIIALLTLVVALLGSIQVGESVSQVPIYFIAIPIVLITGLVLVILDITKSKKELK